MFAVIVDLYVENSLQLNAIGHIGVEQPLSFGQNHNDVRNVRLWRAPLGVDRAR